MKKINLIETICLLALLVLICGCENSNINKEILKESGYYFSSSIKCDEIKEIGYFGAYSQLVEGEKYFVTKDGSLYELNLHQLFSNNKNCIKVDYGNNNISHVVGNDFYDKDYNLIYTSSGKKIISVEEFKNEKGWDYSSYDFKDEFDYVSSPDGYELYYIKNHTVFWYDWNNKENEIYEIPSNETILGFYGNLIKTDKNYYIYQIINREECKKYADIDCKYNYLKLNFDEIKDNIIFISDVFLIDKNWNLYERFVD